MKKLICAVTVVAVSTVQAGPGADAVPGGCDNCTAIGNGVIAGNNAGTNEPDITSCTFNDTAADWYCYTASCDGTATATTCGSGFDTALSAWDSCGGTELACSDDNCALQSTITWIVSAGTAYFVRVSGYNGGSGDYVLTMSCEHQGGEDCVNCLEPNPAGEPGCSDQDCQDIVCATDPFCCEIAWDSTCADLANALCDCGCGCRSDADCPVGHKCVNCNCFTSCFEVSYQQVVCHSDGTTFTFTVEGINACTGGLLSYSYTASGGAVGQLLCFTLQVGDGGSCCMTEICFVVPDCSLAALPSDLDGDGLVGMTDFLALLAAWGSCSDCSTPQACPGDFDGDCSVGILDLLILLGNWS